MRRPSFAAGLLLALAVAVWLILKWSTTDEALIRKQLKALAADCSFTPDDGMLTKTAKASRLTEALSPNVTVNLTRTRQADVYLNGRADMGEKISLVHLHVRSLQVQFPDVSVAVAPERTNATALVTAEARFGGERDLNLLELKLQLQKIEGRWLIVSVEDYQTLEQ